MRPEAQRIAIAEACGFSRPFPDTHPRMWRGPVGGCLSPLATDDVLPDYLNSLDAMHEAEKVLPDLKLYRRFLYLATYEDPTNKGNEPAFTTAAQRAEAFLRTLNLWTDEA